MQYSKWILATVSHIKINLYDNISIIVSFTRSFLCNMSHYGQNTQCHSRPKWGDVCWQPNSHLLKLKSKTQLDGFRNCNIEVMRFVSRSRHCVPQHLFRLPLPFMELHNDRTQNHEQEAECKCTKRAKCTWQAQKIHKQHTQPSYMNFP